MRVITMILLLSMLTTNTMKDRLSEPNILPVVVVDDEEPYYVNNMKRNNPFNIRRSDKNKWVGKVYDNTGPFEVFDTLGHGIRAGMKLLLNYNTIYNLNTVEGIISKFAPPNENNTNGYIASIYKYTGFDKGKVLDLSDRDTMVRLAVNIIVVESGVKLDEAVLYNVYDKYF